MTKCKNGIAEIKVLAPNKNKSNLFTRLLEAFTGDKDAAYTAFLNTRTKGFKDWFKQNPVTDNNGEPAVQVNPATKSFTVQTINQKKVDDIVELNSIETIIGKLGIFDTYFRLDNRHLKEALRRFNITDTESNYIMSLAKDGDNISNVLNSRYSKLINTDKVLTRLNQLKQREYSQELDNALIEFGASIGVTVDVVNSLKEKFGVNAAGIADILNKIIYVSKDRKMDTMAEEIGHFYSELMGYKDGLGRQLFNAVPNWSGYKAVYEKYKTVYTHLDGSPDVDKITKEAIGQAIAEGIIKEYATKDKTIPAEERAFWKLITEAIKRAVGLFKGLSYRNIDVLTSDIAKKILANDSSDIINRLKETTDKNKQLKTYDASLEDFPDAKSVIDRVRDKFDGILTGSLALRYHGTVYRNESETIHDLDFSIPYNSWKGDDKAFKKQIEKEFPNLLWVNEDPYTSKASSTYNAIITDKPELVEKFRSLTGNFNKRLDEFTHEEQQEMLLIDLFLMNEGIEIKHTNNLQAPDVIFNAKSQMGMRPKDSFDLLNYISYEKPTTLSSYVYYQINDPQQEDLEDVLSDEASIKDENVARIQKVVEYQLAKLTARIKDMQMSRNRLGPIDRQERDKRIEELQDLLDKQDELGVRAQFISIIDYVGPDLQRKLSWLKKPADKGGFDINKITHLDAFKALVNQLETFQGINTPKYAAKHSVLRGKIEEIDDDYKEIKDLIKEKGLDVMNSLLKYSTNAAYTDKKNWDEYQRESKDIGGLEANTVDIDTSSDTTLGIVGKIFAAGNQEVDDLANEATTKIYEAGKKLVTAGLVDKDGKADYSWMTSTDANGKKTGNIIQRVGEGFKTALAELFAATDLLEVDENGRKKKMEYVKKPLNELTAEEKAHNLELAGHKKAIAAFLRPEEWNKKLKWLVDGQNKRYTDDFKAARDLYEVYEEGGWVMSANVTEEQYRKYLRQYYGPKVTIWRLVKDETTGEVTGEVEEYETRFVKDIHQEITEVWNSKEYEAIQNDPVKAEYYNFYVQTKREILDKLPADEAKYMDGKIFRIKDQLIDTLMSKKTSVLKRILKEIKQLFLPNIITNGRTLDENHRATNDVARFFTGPLQSEKRLAQLREQIATLTGTKDKEDLKKLKSLKESLVIEENKLTPENINYDLTEEIIVGFRMATHYDVMKNMESKFQIIQSHLHNKKIYKNVDSNGLPVRNSAGEIEYKDEGTSNVEKRLQDWMRMVFYNNSQANNTRVAKLALLLKKYTSFLNVGGLAIFPAFNNIITAEMSNIIEGFGGRYYKKDNYVKSSVMMAKSLASGRFISHMFKQPGQYEEEQPHDLMTALLHHFNFLEENADRGTGIKQKQTVGQYIKSGNILYALTEGGEYQAQARTGLAYLDNKSVKDGEGNDISLLDAYVFDEVTKKLSLKPGVKFSPEERRRTTNEIRNMNKTIHGNHSSIDKVPIQENWYGELAFQFKRWMPNAIRSRWGGTYFDESTGLEQEGRYRAVKDMFDNMTGLMSAFNGEAYNKLTELQQANMRKNATEVVMFGTALALYIIFDAVGESLPPDDEKTKMAINFLKKQADRSMGEMDFFINPMQWYSSLKSPVASLGIVKEVGEFVGALAGIPFYGLQGKTEKWKFDKGTNKGEYRVLKQGMDLIPVLKQRNAIKQLEKSGDFFM